MNGEREISQTEDDIYRQTEIVGAGWKAFRLTSLLPKTGFDVHVAKMTTATPATTSVKTPPEMLMRRRVVE